MSVIGNFQSILLFYQQYYSYTNVKLSELIDLQVYTFDFFNTGREFLIELLQNQNFIHLTIQEMNLEFLKIKTVNSSIHNFFYRKPKFFTSQEIQRFFQLSINLEKKIENIIHDIEINSQGLSINENLKLQNLQKNYRSYILETFWSKFYENLKSETPSVNSTVLIQRIQKKVPVWEVEILYNREKVIHFDFISSQFRLYSSKKEEMKKGRLSFFGDPGRLPKIENPFFTHNMIVKEINPKLDFSINQKDNIYYIKYDINSISIKSVKRVFIYGYCEYKQKKIFIGFAYRNNDHYREIYQKYYNLIHT